MRFPKFSLAIAGLALALAACAGEPPPSQTPGHPTPTATPTPTPTPDPTRPPAADLRISTTGLGTLMLGGMLPDSDDPDVAMVSRVDDLCISPAYDVAAGDPEAAGWLPDPSYDVSGVHGFEVYAPDDVLQRIDISSVGIATEAGVRVGDAESAVVAAYPSVSPHDIGPFDRLFVVTADSGSLGIVVDVASAKVRMLRATAPGIDQVDVAMGNSSIAGCSFILP
jgi:hypothetical protein